MLELACLSRFAAAIGALTLLASCGGGTSPAPVSQRPTSLKAAATASAADVSPRVRGMHLAGEYYYANQVQLGNPTQAWLDYLQRSGVDWVGVSISMFSKDLADPTVYVRTRLPGEGGQIYRTFSDEQLAGFTRAAHARGIKVYWTLAFDQPVFDAGGGDPQLNANPLNCGTPQYNVPRYQLGAPDAPTFNRCIQAADWFWSPSHPQYAQKVGLFFSSMTSVATRYGTLAQQLGVEMYSLGTETEWLWRTRSTVGGHFKPQLQAMVDAVRSVYGGLLTYDQHVAAAKSRFNHTDYIPVFADLGLDVVGVSYYSNQVTSPPTGVVPVETLKAGFLADFDNYIAKMKTANGSRPVVFTEFGFVNSVGAPWLQDADLGGATTGDANGNGIFDGDEQQSNLLTAFAAAVDARAGLVTGGFMWGQPVFLPVPEVTSRIDFAVYGRPQEAALRQAYTAWAARQPSFPAPSAESYDCLFTRLEALYPTLLNPSSDPRYNTPLLYRHYSGTGSFLAANVSDAQLYYLGPASGNSVLPLGPVSQWLSQLGCARI